MSTLPTYEEFKKKLTVVVLDESPIVSWGISRFIEESFPEAVVHQCYELTAFVNSIDLIDSPDIVILGPNMPSGTLRSSKIDSIKRNSTSKWLVLTNEVFLLDTELKRRMLRSLSKYSSLEQLSNEVARLRTGIDSTSTENLNQNLCVGYTNVQNVVNNFSSSVSTERFAALSRRQSQVYECLLKGMSNKKIALTLNIAESTVKEHMTNIMKILGVQTRMQVLTHSSRRVHA
jgi:two-component system, NarL family, nitrate/nitrite response regulator NarL